MLRKAVAALVAASALVATDVALAQNQCTSGGEGIWAGFCSAKKKQTRLKRIRQQAAADQDSQSVDSSPAPAASQAGNGAPQSGNGQAKAPACTPSADRPCPHQ